MTFSEKEYIFLSCLFAVIIVTINMVFQKFVTLSLGEFLSMELSLGILLYPITFLISDLVTEVYGRKHASYMVTISVLLSALMAGVIFFFDSLESTKWSPVDNDTFHRVFGNYFVAIFSSLVAVYISQLLDITIFSWLKEKTEGRHLWLRNSASTAIAQIVDTLCVTVILAMFHILKWDQIPNLFFYGLTFKILSAILTTPFCYLGRFILKR